MHDDTSGLRGFSRPTYSRVGDALTLSGRTLCRELWMTKSMWKILKNSFTVMVPSSNFCHGRKKRRTRVSGDEVKIKAHSQRLWRRSDGCTYRLHVIGVVLNVGFEKALFPGCGTNNIYERGRKKKTLGKRHGSESCVPPENPR